MSKLRFRISMSLDGFTAGPRQSVELPLGVGGERLHEWAMEISLVPALLGEGERLFDGTGDDLRGLRLMRTIAAANVTHLKLARA